MKRNLAKAITLVLVMIMPICESNVAAHESNSESASADSDLHNGTSNSQSSAKVAPANHQELPAKDGSVVPGTLESERTQLMKAILSSKELGIGVAPYLEAFTRTEEQVKAGVPEDQVRRRIESIRDSLNDQLKRRRKLQEKPKIEPTTATHPSVTSKTSPKLETTTSAPAPPVALGTSGNLSIVADQTQILSGDKVSLHAKATGVGNNYKFTWEVIETSKFTGPGAPPGIKGPGFALIQRDVTVSDNNLLQSAKLWTSTKRGFYDLFHTADIISTIDYTIIVTLVYVPTNTAVQKACAIVTAK